MHKLLGRLVEGEAVGCQMPGGWVVFLLGCRISISPSRIRREVEKQNQFQSNQFIYVFVCPSLNNRCRCLNAKTLAKLNY